MQAKKVYAMGKKLQKPQYIEAAAKQEQPQQEEDTNFTCELCIEPVLVNRKFINSSLCVHPFCVDCIAKYIEAKFEGITGNIKCPELNCQQLLDPLSCKPLIPKSIFEKWCDLLCDSTVLGLEKCYCPYQNCSVLILNECKDKSQKVQCPKCKRNFCFGCQIPWHAGYKCNESGQLRDMNDVLVGQLIEQKQWTRCYRCGHSVERISGCRMMKCRCGALFCHRCGGRTHLGPCKHRRCEERLSFFLILANLAILCYFSLWGMDLLSARSN